MAIVVLLILLLGVNFTSSIPDLFLLGLIANGVMFFNQLLEKGVSSFFRILFFFQLAFLLIISFEGIFFYDELVSHVGEIRALPVAKYINYVLVLFFIGVLVGKKIVTTRKAYQPLKKSYSQTFLTIAVIGCIYAFYVYTTFDYSIQAFSSGRHNASFSLHEKTLLKTLLRFISKAASFVLPSIIAFYFRYVIKKRNYAIISFIACFPIWAFIFMVGSRYPLLFSFLSYFIVVADFSKIDNKKVFVYSLLGIIFLFSASFMKIYRVAGTDTTFEASKFINFEAISINERAVKNTGTLFDYFERPDVDYMYGKSSSFIFYFWVPRAIWKDKPTTLGYWLIRSYYGGNVGFRKSYSIDFGFYGDAYADFGYKGGIFFCAILGIFFGRLDRWVFYKTTSKNSIAILYAAQFFPFSFFAVRSLNTSIFALLQGFFIIFIFQLTLKSKRY